MELNLRHKVIVGFGFAALMIVLIGFFISRNIQFREDGKAPDSLKGELLSIRKNLDEVIRKL